MKERKTYQKPTTTVVKLQQRAQILATSTKMDSTIPGTMPDYESPIDLIWD